MQPKVTLASFCRFILFLLFFMFVLGIINYLFGKLFYWGFSTIADLLSRFNIIVDLIICGFLLSAVALVWGLFKMLASMLTFLNTLISPLKIWNAYAILIISIINAIFLSYRIWTIQTDYGGWIILEAIIFTIYVWGLAIALINGGMISIKDLIE